MSYVSKCKWNTPKIIIHAMPYNLINILSFVVVKMYVIFRRYFIIIITITIYLFRSQAGYIRSRMRNKKIIHDIFWTKMTCLTKEENVSQEI